MDIEQKILDLINRSGGEVTKGEISYNLSIPIDCVDKVIDVMERKGYIKVEASMDLIVINHDFFLWHHFKTLAKVILSVFAITCILWGIFPDNIILEILFHILKYPVLAIFLWAVFTILNYYKK